MNRFATLCAAGALAGGVLLSAQVQIPQPRKASGDSVTPVYEGWFYNEDGSRSFLISYYNRNSQQELDIPIGPNNRFEPGGPDMGQPTHFLPGRQWGMFIVPAPKEFKPEDKYAWTLTANGVTTTIPFRLHPDYVMAPFAEIAVGNTPPSIRFDQNGKTVQGPLANVAAMTFSRTAQVGTPLTLDLWASDDMKYTSGTNAPMSRPRPAVTLRWSKFRGPGAVKFEKARLEAQTIAEGGKAAFNGKATTTATFSDPGDYVLHVTANDYSGDGGQGFGCCWTTALLKVNVKGSSQ